ncbi:MAG: TonB-dependent receptor, partial [Acidobacteriaceae bacterium]|nr:TonB-dependent receptor [Acidobacteriaceae bacterium]
MTHARCIRIALAPSLVALLIGILALSAWGQEVTAVITGSVTDPSGAPVANANVTARDLDRGTTWPTVTNDSGIYNIPRVPVGRYEVKAEAQGFRAAVYPAFTLVLNQAARVDFQLKMGQVSESLEVNAAAPILQTETNDVSTLIDASTITSVPLSSRNYLQLTLLSPGATNVDPDGMRQPQSMLDSGRPYINGNREQANEYLLDGQLNSEDKNNEVGYTPGVDAVQEFNLITQNASAEFGNYEGGIISASIKSGTNNYHGSVFEFFRNDKFNANNFFAGMTKNLPGYEGVLGHAADGTALKPELRYNQFGATFGGPIIKNKLFFFMDYQGQRFVTQSETGMQLFTSAARAGDFSQLPFQLVDPRSTKANTVIIPGNNLATYVATGAGSQPLNGQPALSQSAVAQALFGLSGYPLPQINTLVGNNFFYNSGHALNNDQGDIKIDYNASQRDHLFFRWSQMNLRLVPTTGLALAANGDGGLIRGGSQEPVRNVVLDWTHTIHYNLLNEARIGFNAVGFTQRQTPTSGLGNIGQQLGINGANLQGPGLLYINMSGDQGDASVGQQNLVQVFHDVQGQVEDNLVWTHGRHAVKTGFQYVRLRQNYIYPGNNGVLGILSVGNATGSTLADFWLGDTGGGFRDTGGANFLDQLRGNVYAAYVQDNWRITNTLTVNLGMRFEDHTPLYEIHDHVVNFGLYSGQIFTTANFPNRAL